MAKGADNIEDQFKSLRLSIRTDLMKKNMSQIKTDYGKLKQEFDKQLELDANYEDLEKLKVELEESETALKRFTKETHKAEKDIDEGFISKVKSKFGALAAFLGALFAGKAIGSFFKESIEAYFESEKAAASLQKQLGYTSEALNEYASTVQKTTVFEDDLAVSAMSRIAAFTKDEAQIKALTDAALDLASAKGMDLASAADMVAKTFGSETNALARSGIEINAAAGSTERLTQVTEGISKLYGGQASAQANTYAGKVEILKNKYGDLKETIGKKLAPIIGALSTSFGESVDKMNDGVDSGTNLGKTFVTVAKVGMVLVTTIKLLFIGLSSFVAGVIGFGNLLFQALSAPYKVLINLASAIGKIGPSVVALLKGDWGNVNFGAVADAVSDAFDAPINDIKHGFDTFIKVIENSWNRAEEAVKSAQRFGENLDLEMKYGAGTKFNTGDGSAAPTESPEVKQAEEDADKLKQLAELKLQGDEEYYAKKKWFDREYGEFLKKQWAKELAEYEKAGLEKYKLDALLLERKKEAEADFNDWWLKNKEKILREESVVGGVTFGDRVSDIEVPRKPFDLTKTPVNPINERLIPGTPESDFSSLDAAQKLLDKSVEGKLAWEALGNAASSTLSLIKVRLAEDASEMEQIWAGMVNGMIEKLAGLAAQWLLFNTIASFLPGAGFGSVTIKSLLGITEKAATGGNFLGTNSGVLRLAAGGDFMVPQGFPNDSYPMLVQSGERVKVTPSGKIGDEARLLAEIKNAIEANTLDRRMLGSKPVIVQPKIIVGQRELAKEMKKSEKVIAREGWKQE